MQNWTRSNATGALRRISKLLQIPRVQRKEKSRASTKSIKPSRTTSWSLRLKSQALVILLMPLSVVVGGLRRLIYLGFDASGIVAPVLTWDGTCARVSPVLKHPSRLVDQTRSLALVEVSPESLIIIGESSLHFFVRLTRCISLLQH